MNNFLPITIKHIAIKKYVCSIIKNKEFIFINFRSDKHKTAGLGKTISKKKENPGQKKEDTGKKK